MKNKNRRLVVLITMCLLLVLPIFSVQATNQPYTEQEINSLGKNKFKMINSIGVHKFNFSEKGDFLQSEGYLYLANTYDTSTTVKLEVIDILSIVDLDDKGNPRTHKVTNNIYYYSLPDKSWITLEEKEFVVNANSEYKVKYKVQMPTKDAYLALNKNNSHGFLFYINVKTGQESFINVNYNYKCFLTFEGTYEESINNNFIILLINILLI